MFDFDPGKFLIIGVVALIVIGPKELPRVLRQVGQMVGRVRRMATEFQGQFMDAMKEADIESIREDLKRVASDAELDTHFDPARDIQRELTASLDQPASAAGVPALAELPPAATEGFALPELTHASIEDAPAEPPAADAAVMAGEPVVAGDAGPADPLAHVNGASVLPAGKKRKIRMLKRRTVPRDRRHAVSDRTASARARGSLARGQEVAGR